MQAEEYLTRLSKLMKLIQNKKAERDLWREIAAGAGRFSTGERVQSTSNPQKLADAVLEKIGLEDAITEAIRRLEKEWMEIITTLEMLPPVHYDVLHLGYIQGLNLDEIADRYQKSRRWAWNKRSDALRRLQRILDDRQPCPITAANMQYPPAP